VDKDTTPRLVRTFAPDVSKQLETLERLLYGDLSALFEQEAMRLVPFVRPPVVTQEVAQDEEGGADEGT
jgi:hypothetical protein